jgi:hypothetical protein
MNLLEVLSDIVNVNYYQKLLDLNSKISITQRKYLQGVLDSIKKKEGKTTPRQYEILQKIKKGDFSYHSKN